MKNGHKLIVIGLLCCLFYSRPTSNVGRNPAADFKSKRINPENFIVDDHLRLYDFSDNKKFYISNSESSSNLIIHNNIAGEKSINLKMRCENLLQDVELVIAKGKSKSIFLPVGITNCIIEYSSATSNKTAEVTVQNETKAFPFLKQIQVYSDTGPRAHSLPPTQLQKFFSSEEMNNTTGILSTDEFKTLETPESGFLEKMKALIGYDLGEEFIKNQNPYAYIDFSKAPKLDAIFVSTLVFRSDFYGTVLTRALKHQAEQGALINIITTEYMMFQKDRNLLEPLTSMHPNFRLQEFKYKDPHYDIGRPLRIIDSTFRDMHIKMFVTLSKENPENNTVIFGGRNVHDGFLFKTKPDYSKYPELIQYGKEDSFVHWNDFEMKLTSTDMAKNAYAHLMRFWHRDTYTQHMSEAIPVSHDIAFHSPSLFRHVLSIPYNDENALEKFFIEMIDSSMVSIKISSPYLSPTPGIRDALNRAAERGVEITIQTRINLEGDTQAWLYSEVNKEAINRFYKKMKIYEWVENSILHSKFILVDGKVAFIGSVNLSRRSFIQDVENGFLIQSEEIVKKMDSIFSNYIANSKLIESHQSRSCFASMLVFLLKNQF